MLNGQKMSSRTEDAKHRPPPAEISGSAESVVNNPEFRLLTTLVWHRISPSTSSSVTSAENDGRNDMALSVTNSPHLDLLPLHSGRLATAAKAMGWHDIYSLHTSTEGLDILQTGIRSHLDDLPEPTDGIVERRKVRVLLSRGKCVKVDSTVMDELPLQQLSKTPFMPDTLDLNGLGEAKCVVYVDTRSTKSSLFTTHKTSYRPHYDAARVRADITAARPTEKEVILYNQDSDVTEGSLSTVYLYRGDTWITPAESCGGSLGITRRLALEKGLCKEGVVKVTELVDGERIWLSNGARGFFIGRICPKPDIGSIKQ